MRKTYTAEIRVLLCETCGAPLEAPVGGGAIGCSYCRSQNMVATRDERPTLGMPAMAAPIDEGERLRRLRAQDGRPLVPPPSIMHLLSGSSFEPSKVEEAFLVYQATRKEVKTTHSPDAAERLFFLTLVGSNYLSSTGDDARRRAMLETSLDTLFLPRHKQVIRCQLASASAKEGDLAAAERWLSPCNPRSDDLESDSAWRCARAYIDTVRGDYNAVLAVLGAVDDMVPIDDSRDPWAAVLRANALERLGDVANAVHALQARMRNESASGRLAIEQIVRLNAHLGLCAQSLPIATQSHAQHAAQAAASGAGGGVGLILLVIGGGLLLFGIGTVVVTAFGLIFSDGWGGEAIITGLSVAAGPGIAGLIMTPLGLGLYRSAREAKFLRVHGVPATGIVRGLEGTGVSINDVPVMRIHLQVMRDGMAPYEASCKQLLSPSLAAQIRPGAQIPLRVHPQKPDKLILELT